MPTKSIPLSRTYEAHGKVFSAVTLREPSLREYLSIGEPIEMHTGPDGEGRYVIEHGDRILDYLDKLAVAGEPGAESLAVLELADAMAVKAGVLDFFTAARQQRAKPTS